VVELEGPILEERLASIVVGRFGMSRLRAARRDLLVPAFAHLDSTTTEFGVTYWPASRSAVTWKGFRTSRTVVARKIDEVPMEELSNAIVELVRIGASATETEAIRVVAAAFGRPALTQILRERLAKVLAWSVENGRLTLEQELYRKTDELAL